MSSSIFASRSFSSKAVPEVCAWLTIDAAMWGVNFQHDDMMLIKYDEIFYGVEILDFKELQSLLDQSQSELHPAYLHGRLTGLVTGAKPVDALSVALGLKVTPEQQKRIDLLAAETKEALTEFSDFDFRLLIPDDDSPVNDRTQAIAEWCTGYLTELNEQPAVRQLGEEVAELVTDLMNIGSLTEEVPESEDNEYDLMQIQEYVRIAVLNIFAELNR